jgi:hypothetical protein
MTADDRKQRLHRLDPIFFRTPIYFVYAQIIAVGYRPNIQKTILCKPACVIHELG